MSAPLDRLLLSAGDMRRLGLRAGDWVAVAAAAPEEGEEEDGSSTPVKKENAGGQGRGAGVAVMRAWPAVGIALPAGTVGGRMETACMWNR